MSSQKQKPILTVELPQYRSSPSGEIDDGWIMEHNRPVERVIETTVATILSVGSNRLQTEIKSLFESSLHHNIHRSKYICRYIGEQPLNEVLDIAALKALMKSAGKVLGIIDAHTTDGVIPRVGTTGNGDPTYNKKTNTVEVADGRITIVAEALGKVIQEMRKDKQDRFRGSKIDIRDSKTELTVTLPRKLVSTVEDKSELTSVSGRIRKVDLMKRTSVIESQTGEDKGQTYEISWSSCDDREDAAKVITSTLARDGMLWISGYRVCKRSIRGENWFHKVTAVQIDNDYTRLQSARQARNKTGSTRATLRGPISKPRKNIPAFGTDSDRPAD